MKNICHWALGLFVAQFVAVGTACAQAPAWHTALAPVQGASGNVPYSVTFATAADASGNVWLAGSFEGTVSFGATTLQSLGRADAFVAKWNPISGFTAALRAGGSGQDGAQSLTLSGGNVYVAGFFESATADFGGSTVTSNNIAAGRGDVFIAKVADTGSSPSFSWALSAGGQYDDAATAVAASGSSVYLTGWYSGPAVSFGTTTLAGSPGSADIFVAKVNDAGTTGSFVWAERGGGGGNNYAHGLAVQGNSVYVTGSIASLTAFGNSPLTPLSNGTGGSSDAFVAKLTDAGSSAAWIWARRAGSAVSNDAGFGIAVDGPSIYVTGKFGGATADFGSLNLSNPAPATDEGFVTRLTDAGATASFDWAQRYGGMSNDLGRAVLIRGNRVYLSGYFSDVATFGTTTLTTAGGIGPDIFLAKLTDAGSSASVNWAAQAGGVGSDAATCLTASGNRLYVGGGIAPPATFGPLMLSGTAGSTSAFLASLTDLTLPVAGTAPPREAAAASLYPNPAHGRVVLRSNEAGQAAPLVLTDALSREVRRYPAPASAEATLDLSGLAPGLYVLRCGSGKQLLQVE